MRDQLEAAVQWAFGSSEGAPTRDANALFGALDEVLLGTTPTTGLTWGWRPVTLADYRHAVDQRRAKIASFVGDGEQAAAVVEFSGRQIGALGSVIPTAREFESFAIWILEKGATHLRLSIQTGVLNDLSAWGFRWDADGLRANNAPAVPHVERLSAHPEETLWAHAWSLPPRLARLAVLLMAGERLAEIASHLSLTPKSVTTYTEELFALAGIHSRSELPLAALRVSTRPHTQPSPDYPNFPNSPEPNSSW